MIGQMDLAVIMMFIAWLTTLIIWAIREHHFGKIVSSYQREQKDLMMLQKAATLTEYTEMQREPQRTAPASNNFLKEKIVQAYQNFYRREEDDAS